MVFIKQQSFKTDFTSNSVTKYISSRTGLQITLIDRQSPIVEGFFVFATEIEDDSGCPHTLEHLIFMGSKKYPYKGLLDTLGNRFFSSTNAWTGVDQTVYTLSTAGWEGFKTLLPIYLDHIFFPTLTDEACLTEVYHIDGKGKEKGVVFSEMQGIVSQSWFINSLNLQRSMYPEKCGYSSETGGLLPELRKLTNEQIRDFHSRLYRPDNLCTVIIGSVDEAELLEVMEKFDAELPDLPSPAPARPFVDSVSYPLLKETKVHTVEFPDKDETMGELRLSWIGPPLTDTLLNFALDIIGDYFTESSISVLKKNLVEITSPYATEVSYHTDEYVKTSMNYSLIGVPTDKLEEAATKLQKLLIEHSKVEVFDLNRIRQVLKQSKLEYMFKIENDSTHFFDVAIAEFLYGERDGSTLPLWLKGMEEFDELSKWTAEQWCEVIKIWLVDNHSATMLCKPSESLYEKNIKENKAISKSIKEMYGKEGLAKLAENLSKAQEKNDTKISDTILTQFGKPDLSKIKFLETKSYAAGLNKANELYLKDEFSNALIEDTPENFPLYFHIENFKSQFLTINLVFSTAEIELSLLPYIVILDVLFSSPMFLPDGSEMKYEDVVANLKKDVIDHSFDSGFEGSFEQLTSFKFKLPKDNYINAIKWFTNIIHNMKFDQERVKVTIEKYTNSLAEKKRSGHSMMESISKRKLFTERSAAVARDCIYNENFFKSKLKLIEDGNFDQVAKELTELKNQFFKLDNTRIVIVGDLTAVPKPISSWSTFVDPFKNKSVGSLVSIPRDFNTKSELGKVIKDRAFLLSAPASESAFLSAVTEIPTDYKHPDVLKIALASEYLTAVEGPFWRGIRGTGLAYGAYISRSLESGTLTFSLYRAADAIQAFQVAKKIVDDFVSGVSKFEPTIIENCIASFVNGIANSESNFIDAANNKFLDNILKQRGPNFNSFFLEQLKQITEKDLIEVMSKYFQSMFNSKQSMVFVCLHPSNVDKFSKVLASEGYDVETEELSGDVNQDDHSHDCDSCGSSGESGDDSTDGSENGSDDDSDEESEESDYE